MKLQVAKYISNIIEQGKLDGKEIFVFGANASGAIIIDELLARNFTVSYILDNNKNLSGTSFLDFLVYRPEEILLEKKQNAMVFIASRYYDEMKSQLESLGYKENVHIFQVVNLNSHSDFDLSIETFEKHKQKLYEGLKVYERLKDKYDANLIMMSPVKPNGDVYIICSYLNEYIKMHHNDENYVFTVVNKSCELIAKLFNVPNVEIISEEDNNNLAKLANFYPELITVFNPYYNYQEVYHHIDGYKGINFVQEIKHGIMNLPLATLPEKPNFTSDELYLKHLFDELGLVKGKSVILAPFANSIHNLTVDFWEALVQSLKEKGLRVFTNCGTPNEQPIKGSERIFFKFADAVPVVEYAGYVISYRSGFSDIIGSSKCKKIIVYPYHIKGHSTLRVLYGMDDVIYEQGDLYEIEHQYSSTVELLEAVLSYTE